ncbi:hypothetical protein LPJ56_003544, partial [Coemansia sp. RSA 2599]
ANGRDASAQYRTNHFNINEYMPPQLEEPEAWKRGDVPRETSWAVGQSQAEVSKHNHRTKTKAGYYKSVVPPCPMDKEYRRTLFMRVDDGAVLDRAEIRDWFSSFGEVAFVLDFIRKSGICYVMYYDSRCAQKALRQAGDRIMINGISIRLYPSRPRPNAVGRSPNQDDYQATVLFTLAAYNSAFQEEDTAMFLEFGDVCAIYLYKNRPNECIVEYFDVRSATKAGLTCHDREFRGVKMYTTFFWDNSVSRAHSKTGLGHGLLNDSRVLDKKGPSAGSEDAPAGFETSASQKHKQGSKHCGFKSRPLKEAASS